MKTLINYDAEERQMTRLWFNDDNKSTEQRLWETQQLRNRLAGDNRPQANDIRRMADELIEIFMLGFDN